MGGLICGEVSEGCGGTILCECPTCQTCAGISCEPVANQTECGDGGVCCNGVCCDGCCGTDGSCGSCTVFITTNLTTANLGGVAGANATCQRIADDVGLAGSYAAWISDSTAASEPVNRFRRSGRPYVLVDGTKVANDWDDLTTEKQNGDYLADNINLNVDGDAVTDNPVWTNTKPDGSRRTARGFCAEWTDGSSGPLEAPAGFSGFVDAAWTQAGIGSCGQTARLYCFQQE